jgi:hypothetical protein
MFTPKNLLPLSTINKTKTSCDSKLPIHISTSHTKCWLGTCMQSFGFWQQQKCIHFLSSYHGYITLKFCQTICPYMSSRRNKHTTLKDSKVHHGIYGIYTNKKLGPTQYGHIITLCDNTLYTWISFLQKRMYLIPTPHKWEDVILA